ncbi:DUF6338 family protein [Cohnella mopanensis]|uniref:DUF6338 family protein n=1 Tax=Cohnella mopanensis TaxID=2911966 RepID=UPI001EF82645|nr:DUF6338 family protein [Cohnella mopanensis]
MELNGDTFFYITFFIVPGFVMNAAYSSIIPQRILDQQVALLRFLTFSFINFIVWYWLIVKLISEKFWKDEPVYWLLILFGLLVLSPYILGFISGVITSKSWLRNVLTKLGINPMHSVPTAWDYVLKEGNWVIVTFKDGTLVYGLYNDQSFASSIHDERDVYIQAVYDRDSVTGDWEIRPRTKGMWIAKEEIKSIEFIKFEN